MPAANMKSRESELIRGARQLQEHMGTHPSALSMAKNKQLEMLKERELAKMKSKMEAQEKARKDREHKEAARKIELKQ